MPVLELIFWVYDKINCHGQDSAAGARGKEQLHGTNSV